MLTRLFAQLFDKIMKIFNDYSCIRSTLVVESWMFYKILFTFKFSFFKVSGNNKSRVKRNTDNFESRHCVFNALLEKFNDLI